MLPTAGAGRLEFPIAERSADYDMAKAATSTRLWDLHPSLHCSIIGTCLTSAELRQILRRIGVSGADKASDHDLHGTGVTLCSKRDAASKLLHKALDRKHRATINEFGRARSADEVLALWRDSLEKGDIPGAYWAVLTHAKADDELVRVVFGDMHMLSHLAGAANRADLRRLRQLQEQNAALFEKMERQQIRFRAAIAKRNEMIRGLKSELAKALALRVAYKKQQAECRTEDSKAAEVSVDQQQKLNRQAMQIARLETRLEAMLEELTLSKKECTEWQQQCMGLRSELEAADACLSAGLQENQEKKRLTGRTLLYVGGRSNQVPQLKKLAEDSGARFLHHDGGLEDNSHSLAAFAARADAILFPVDCISHGAVFTLKRACKQLSKKYVPLRSSGLTSFAACIQRLELPAGCEHQDEGGQA